MSRMDGGLTGYWTGEYAYPVEFSSVAFNAQLEEVAGYISGSITEPDPNGFFDPVIVISRLSGSRDGPNVRFVRTMLNAGRHDSILYVGVVNEAETEIRGRWIILGDWSGNFQMTRGDLGEEESVNEAAEVDA